MTLVAAWVRKFKYSSQLIVASDSRLSGGMRWDCCPKIFPLNRGDSAICFAGDTQYAYPIILQVSMMINMHDKVSSRALDICDLQSTIINIANKMLEYRHDFSSDKDAKHPDVKFLFVGYSWTYQNFMIWEYKYSYNDGTFSSHKTNKNQFSKHQKWPFIFVGDHSYEAKKELLIQLEKKFSNEKRRNIDMEPFDILKKYIFDSNKHEIGGPIQLLKIYRHLNCIPFNVLWPDSNGEKTLLGRPLLPYERNHFLTLDADTKIITDPRGVTLRSFQEELSAGN